MKINEIILVYDSGTSGGKAIVSYVPYEFPRARVERYFLIDPSTRPLTQHTYKRAVEDLEPGVSNLGSCLLSYVEPETTDCKYMELGETASRRGLLPVSDRKFEKCFAKVLTFIGYLVHVQMRTDEPLELSLGVLLPYDEIQDRYLLAQWLRQTIGSVGEEAPGFEFNGVPIKNVRIKKLDIKPEGYGIYAATAEADAGIFVVGHSDSSFLYFGQGKLNITRTCTFPETGMHDFLRTIDFPIGYELWTAQILSEAGPQLKANKIAQLTQTKSEAEIELARRAISEAKSQYWLERMERFSSLDVSGLDRVYISGGAAQYFSTELKHMSQQIFKVRLNWCGQLMMEFCDRFSLKQTLPVVYRFADPYGYYRTLPGIERFESKNIEAIQGRGK